MTVPTRDVPVLAPPPDGLMLAFTAARRRRHATAALTALGAAVAVASTLAFLAPPGRTLLQQPLPPAGGGLLPAVGTAPAPGTVVSRSSPARARAVIPVADVATERGRTTNAQPAAPSIPPRPVHPQTAARARCPHGARCAAVQARTSFGGAKVRAVVCGSAATAGIDDVPAAPESSLPRHLEVGTGSCDPPPDR